MASYNLSFTAASLRPELSRILAELYLTSGSWTNAKELALTSNALQARTPSSAKRLERELRQRLQLLTDSQLHLLAHSSADDRAAMSWLAMLKYNAFAYEFAVEVLREKVDSHDHVLRPSDYEGFFERKAAEHPELASLASTTRSKVRSVLLRCLIEAGLLTDGAGLGTVQRPVTSPAARDAIAEDSPAWLAGFLGSDREVLRR